METYSRILFHGTKNREGLVREGFDNAMLLSGRGAMAYGRGFYLTPNKTYARRFGEVVLVRVVLHNPYPGKEFFARFGREIIKGQSDKITNTLITEGHDGILVQNDIKDMVCVFDAKSLMVVG